MPAYLEKVHIIICSFYFVTLIYFSRYLEKRQFQPNALSIFLCLNPFSPKHTLKIAPSFPFIVIFHLLVLQSFDVMWKLLHFLWAHFMLFYFLHSLTLYFFLSLRFLSISSTQHPKSNEINRSAIFTKEAIFSRIINARKI